MNRSFGRKLFDMWDQFIDDMMDAFSEREYHDGESCLELDWTPEGIDLWRDSPDVGAMCTSLGPAFVAEAGYWLVNHGRINHAELCDAAYAATARTYAVVDDNELSVNDVRCIRDALTVTRCGGNLSQAFVFAWRAEQYSDGQSYALTTRIRERLVELAYDTRGLNRE